MVIFIVDEDEEKEKQRRRVEARLRYEKNQQERIRKWEDKMRAEGKVYPYKLQKIKKYII